VSVETKFCPRCRKERAVSMFASTRYRDRRHTKYCAVCRGQWSQAEHNADLAVRLHNCGAWNLSACPFENNMLRDASGITGKHAQFAPLG